MRDLLHVRVSLKNVSNFETLMVFKKSRQANHWQ